MSENTTGPPALWRLLSRIGRSIFVHRANDTGQMTLATEDLEETLEALCAVLEAVDDDEHDRLQAALLLGSDLIPLELTLPRLLELVEHRDSRIRDLAAIALEALCPAPGNEDLTRPPSKPAESFMRIAHTQDGEVAEFARTAAIKLSDGSSIG